MTTEPSVESPQQFAWRTPSTRYAKERAPEELTPRQVEYVTRTPEKSAGIVERALQATATPRAAIKAYCLVCTNWQRDEVAHCATEICPLWRYRPYRAKR